MSRFATERPYVQPKPGKFTTVRHNNDGTRTFHTTKIDHRGVIRHLDVTVG